MHRRRFVQVAAAGALALGLPDAGPEAPARLHALAHPGLLALFGDRRKVLEIGVAHRTAFPSERTPATLSATLLAGAGAAAHLPDTLLHERLERQVRRDFERGHTVRLNGWILSRTEARQCALYSLLYP